MRGHRGGCGCDGEKLVIWRKKSKGETDFLSINQKKKKILTPIRSWVKYKQIGKRV